MGLLFWPVAHISRPISHTMSYMTDDLGRHDGSL